jgi:hypothetical protein
MALGLTIVSWPCLSMCLSSQTWALVQKVKHVAPAALGRGPVDDILIPNLSRDALVSIRAG